MPKSSGSVGGRISDQGAAGYSVEGDMTFNTVRGLLSQSKAMFAQESDLKLLLGKVEHADSAGLALLLEWVAEARRGGRRISVDRIPDSLRAIARLCRMEDELDSFIAPKPQG